MKNMVTGLSPARDDSLVHRRQVIVDWWVALEMSGDAGETTWEVLDPLRDIVTACLALDPPDIGRAESATAHALCLVGGLKTN